jgi:hypothetical protein
MIENSQQGLQIKAVSQQNHRLQSESVPRTQNKLWCQVREKVNVVPVPVVRSGLKVCCAKAQRKSDWSHKVLLAKMLSLNLANAQLKNVPKYRTTWTVTKVHVLAISKTQIVR